MLLYNSSEQLYIYKQSFNKNEKSLIVLMSMKKHLNYFYYEIR